ncbi:MAG: type I-E CRISPR-associated protein Cas7/Cse4/CasC [Candidatus Anammoxibacter sp.]
MRLIELHILQSFPVTCLNRDDVGAPKSAFFGGTQRARVSSQCWKRAIRDLAKEAGPGLFEGQRTRYLVKPLIDAFKEKGQEQVVAKYLAETVADGLGKLDNPEKGNVKTLLYFSPGEIDRVAEAMVKQDISKDLEVIISDSSSDKSEKKELDKSKKTMADFAKKAAKSLKDKVKDNADIAIFGRMVADDHTLMLEGAGLFSHALSTHKVSSEIDFFSAVDDAKPEAAEGAGHIGTLEFNSACYYRYIGLNVDLLRDKDHLGHFSDNEFRAVVKSFIEAAIRAVPEARKNSMSGFTLPSHVLGLVRDGQPLSLANAFETPVKSSTNGYIDESNKKMEEHFKKLNETYGLNEVKKVKIPEIKLKSFVTEIVGALNNPKKN